MKRPESLLGEGDAGCFIVALNFQVHGRTSSARPVFNRRSLCMINYLLPSTGSITIA